MDKCAWLRAKRGIAMKIEREKRDLNQYPSLEKTSFQGIKKGTPSSFERELAQRTAGESRYRMQEILQELDRLSEKLEKSLTINDLMLYKKMVKNFLREATTQAYLLKQERGRSRRGRTMLITINVVDAEIEKLINDFIKQKKDPVDVLTLLDKIRGMLVDLMI